MSKRNNQKAVKHGGEGAIRRISEGREFIGLAADEQQAVQADYEAQGHSELVKHNAVRLQTALNLYWNAVQKAAADGDIAGFDRYVARFGWLSGVTLRAWAQVAQNEKAAKRTNIIDVLKGNDGKEED